MARKPKADWCVLDYKASPVVLRCLRCNGTGPIIMPCAIRALVLQMDAFIELHKNCQPPQE